MKNSKQNRKKQTRKKEGGGLYSWYWRRTPHYVYVYSRSGDQKKITCPFCNNDEFYIKQSKVSGKRRVFISDLFDRHVNLVVCNHCTHIQWFKKMPAREVVPENVRKGETSVKSYNKLIDEHQEEMTNDDNNINNNNNNINNNNRTQGKETDSIKKMRDEGRLGKFGALFSSGGTKNKKTRRRRNKHKKTRRKH